MTRIPYLLRALLPGLGLALLLGACGTTVDWDYPRQPSTAFPQPETTAIGALFQEAADRHPDQSGFSLVTEGARAFTARLAMADLAEKTLDAQYYIWDGDTTGRIMADRLIRAADRGVRVRLLLDDHYQSEEADFRISALDTHPNIEVRFFNPLENRRWRNWSFLSDFGRVNHRMHNKLFVMDNAVGIAGGRNIADTYFGVRPDQNFRDLDLAMTGPVVRDLSASFDLFWNSEWAIPVGAVVAEQASEKAYQFLRQQLADRITAGGYPYPVEEEIADLRGRLVDIRDGLVWAPAHVLVENPTRVGGEDAGMVITEAILQRIATTKHEMLVESPYVILLDRGIEIVRELGDRGIKVRILTNSAATNDVLAAHAGYANIREDLLTAGAELYELRPDSDMKRKWSLAAGKSRAALHSKVLVFDRETAFLGSFNFDPRSRFINTEIGIMIDSPEIAAQLAAFMDEGILPGSAFRVALDDDGDLVWTAETDGKAIAFDTDPETTFWQRRLIDVVGLLPIDEQL
ncbi:phospholipase D family protein [Dongia sp.]|uniref:phospholipase D family protein n=1 Tax=Dongia sp. TaxID=1977262 RepID=UPI0035AE53EE